MEQGEIQNIIGDTSFARVRTGIGIGNDLDNEVDGSETEEANGIIESDVESSIDEREAGKQIVANVPSLRTTTFAKVEKSLASLGFFTPSSRRIKSQKVKRVTSTREIDGKRVEVSAEIHPSGMFGLPVTADQDKYLALQKIITNTLQSEGKVSNPIRFKSAELLRLLNTSTRTGKNYKSIGEWLDVMSATTIISDGAVFVAGQKRWARDRFRVFDRALSFGKEMDDGTIADANYVWLSAWQLENINNKYLVPIDLEAYRELKTHIAKALVPLLQIWLFASHKAESFEKRYTELCEILTLQTYRAPSQIRRQLKPSLDELTHHGYIEKWQLVRTSDRKAYKIIFVHGPKFYRDRRRRLERKVQAEPLVVIDEFEAEEARLPEPIRFAEVSTPSVAASNDQPTAEQPSLPEHPVALIDALSARGLMPSTALKLLQSLSPERLLTVEDYIEYWDKAGKERTVGPGFLFDLIRNGDPLPAGFETQRQRTARVAAEDRRKALARLEERLRADYEDHCRQMVDRFVAGALSPEDLEARVTAYSAETAKQEFWKERPEMAEQFARHAVRAEIAKGVNLPAYEDFYLGKLPSVSAELGIGPPELVHRSASHLVPPPLDDTIEPTSTDVMCAPEAQG